MTSQPSPSIQIVHEGRGGYIEVNGRRFQIEHIDAGHFCIHVPRSLRREPELLETLKAFAAARDPVWYLED